MFFELLLMSFKQQFKISAKVQFDMLYKQQFDMFLCISCYLNVG